MLKLKYIILEEFSIILSIIIVVIFLKNNATIIEQSPETKEEKDDTINLSLEEIGSDIKQKLVDKEYKTEYIKKAFSKFRVWKLFILYFLCSFVYNTVNTMYRNIAIRKNISTTIVQVLSVI